MRRGRYTPAEWQAELQRLANQYGVSASLTTPTKGGWMNDHTDIVIGPIETRARQLIGARPECITESDYIYKVRELVDWMGTVQLQWADAAKGGGNK